MHVNKKNCFIINICSIHLSVVEVLNKPVPTYYNLLYIKIEKEFCIKN